VRACHFVIGFTHQRADIKVKEQSVENMMRNRAIFEPPRYMSASDAASQLLNIAERRRAAGVDPGVCVGPVAHACMYTGYDRDTECVAVARLGWPGEQRIVATTLGSMVTTDLGAPLHSLIMCGTPLHECERSMLAVYKHNNVSDSSADQSVDTHAIKGQLS
jgi:diphthine synthase